MSNYKFKKHKVEMTPNEIMVDIEDLTNEKLEWGFSGNFESVIIPIDSLRIIQKHILSQYKSK